VLLHVADLHLNPAGFDLVEQVVEQFDVDAVLDTGDITDWGSEPENRLITRVGTLGVPYVYIRGNHDSAATARLISEQPDATVLNGEAVTVAGISIVGVPDPRFTPDKGTGDDASEDVLTNSGEALAEVAEALPEPPSIALVHDPKQAPPLDGVVPLVLAGHTHAREVSTLENGTLLMVEGSTGGAGLRGLQGEEPTPLACTVLYLDPDTGQLRAYDEITLGGLGETEVTIQRFVVPEPSDDSDAQPADESDESPASPGD
jgi:predicted MPP superfamily phosphohydrolase